MTNLGPRVADAALLAAGLFLGYVAWSAAAGDGIKIDGPRFAPIVVTAAWVLLAAVYLVMAFVRPGLAAAADAEPEAGDRPATGDLPEVHDRAAAADDDGLAEPEDARVPAGLSWRPPALLVAALVAYVLLLAPLGFALASTAFFMAAAWILGSRHPLRDVVVAVPLAFGAYLGFTRLLDIQLPSGVLPL